MFLREVPEPQPMTGHDATGIGLFAAREDPEQRGLPRAVQPEDHQPAPAINGEVDALEHLQPAVRLAHPDRAQRSTTRRCRVGQLDASHPRGTAYRLEVGQELVRAASHVACGNGCGRSGAHLVSLRVEDRCLPFSRTPFARPPLLIRFQLVEILLPARVVDVDRGPVRIQVEHPVDRCREQLTVVADHHESTGVPEQERAQPDDRVGIEVVGRLVEQQGVVLGEQDPGQLDPAPLTARELPDRLVEGTRRQTDTCSQTSGFGLGRITAACLELHLGPGIGSHRALLSLTDGAAHRRFSLPQTLYCDIQAAGRQNPRRDRDGRVGGARVLRQVPDGAGVGDRAGRRTVLAGQGLHQRRLARAVAADQTDAVAGADVEGKVGQQEVGADANIYTASGDHDGYSP